MKSYITVHAHLHHLEGKDVFVDVLDVADNALFESVLACNRCPRGLLGQVSSYKLEFCCQNSMLRSLPHNTLNYTVEVPVDT